MKFKHRETPSGVTKKIYNVDVNGKALDLLNLNINLNIFRKTRISKKLQDEILKFAGKNKKEENSIKNTHVIMTWVFKRATLSRYLTLLW